MEFYGLLSVGFLIGMGHALEADHMAAVATLSNTSTGKKQLVARGAYWGLGHASALTLICGLVIASGIQFSHHLEASLELAVGLLIVFLGIVVLRRIRRQRVHIHVHEHDGTRHLHAHSHIDDPRTENSDSHANQLHDHHHSNKSNYMALAVGLLHGAAGSGALLILIVATTHTLYQSLAYVAIFGLGSVLGMAALSYAVSFPLVYVQKGANWVHAATSLAIAGFALWTGGNLARDSITFLAQTGN